MKKVWDMNTQATCKETCASFWKCGWKFIILNNEIELKMKFLNREVCWWKTWWTDTLNLNEKHCPVLSSY